MPLPNCQYQDFLMTADLLKIGDLGIGTLTSRLALESAFALQIFYFCLTKSFLKK